MNFEWDLIKSGEMSSPFNVDLNKDNFRSDN